MMADFIVIICLFICLTSVQSPTVRECNYRLGSCLHYRGFQANSLQSAVEHCGKNGGKLLEIKSREMQNFVKTYFNNYFIQIEHSKFFMNLLRSDFGKLDPNDIFVEFEPSIYYRHSCQLENFICFTKGYNGIYVELVRLNYSWYDARLYCHESNKSLLDWVTVYEIVTRVWDRFLEKLDYKILRTPNVKWVWSGEDEIPYFTNWKGGCENTSHEDNMRCSVITGESTWMPSRCHLIEPIPVICMEKQEESTPEIGTTNLQHNLIITCGVAFVILLFLVMFLVGSEIQKRTKHGFQKSEPSNSPTNLEEIENTGESRYVDPSDLDQESRIYCVVEPGR